MMKEREVIVTSDVERAVIAHARGQLHPAALCRWCKDVAAAYSNGKQMGSAQRVPS